MQARARRLLVHLNAGGADLRHPQTPSSDVATRKLPTKLDSGRGKVVEVGCIDRRVVRL